MGALVVCGALVVAGAVIWTVMAHINVGPSEEEHRNRVNLHARQIWLNAGGKSYPHRLADGRVRWYRVDHDPVEL